MAKKSTSIILFAGILAVLVVPGILRAGSVVGWGAGGPGQSGWPHYGQASPPAGNDFVAIAARVDYSLALKSDGSIVGWGYNGQGQASPPAGNNFIAISAGGNHSLALKSDGSIVGWGYNGQGQANPPSGNDFVAISAGGYYSLALKSDGSIVGWGSNVAGKATPPAGNDFVAIAAGGDHSLALKSDGSIVGWGNNYYGQATPPAGNDFIALVAGGNYSLALKRDGSIVGWGNNYYGQATPPAGNDFIAIVAGGNYSLALKSDGSIVGWGNNDFGRASPPAGNDFVAIAAGSFHSLALKKEAPKDSASIVSFVPPTGTLERGTTAQATVRVKNTGTTTRSFWVGLSFAEPDAGTWPDGWYDVPPIETKTLSPEEAQDITFEFELHWWMSPGDYTAVSAVWEGFDSVDNLMVEPPFDEETVSAFTLDDYLESDVLEKRVLPPDAVASLDKPKDFVQTIVGYRSWLSSTDILGARLRIERLTSSEVSPIRLRVTIDRENPNKIKHFFGSEYEQIWSQLFLIFPNNVELSNIVTQINGLNTLQWEGYQALKAAFIVKTLGAKTIADLIIGRVISTASTSGFVWATSFTQLPPSYEMKSAEDFTVLAIDFDDKKWQATYPRFYSFNISFDILFTDGVPSEVGIMPDLRYELTSLACPLTVLGSIPIVGLPESLIKLVEYRQLVNILPEALYVDSDEDGISDDIEIATGTDPFDDDTDDDGLLDGPGSGEDVNANGIVDPGETDPRNADTDGDGIQDGTESGLTAPEGLDTDMTVFVPDSDPDTTTDPLNPDTDGDGLSDGEEDLNGNGAVDYGESDPTAITGIIRIEPRVLNLASKGKWVTCYIELPTEFDVSEIDVGSLMLQDTLNADSQPSEIDDYDDDGILDLMVKFNRKALTKILGPGEQIVILTGQLNDGTPLDGIDLIRVID